MPRKGRGGARVGTPGKAYSNRTDLQGGTQAVKVSPSSQYGEGAKLQAAQRAIPLPDNSGLPAGAPSGGAPAGSPLATGPAPGELGAFDRATERPGEHVSTGLPIGAGAGPEALSQWDSGDDVGVSLRAMYQKFPNQDLADLIQVYEANRGGNSVG